MPSGTVVWLQRTPYRGAACVPAAALDLRADRGVEGDRHARPASSRQVVLVRAEVLDDLGLPYGATREQLTIAGLPEALEGGDRLVVGDAVIELVRPRVPCRIMEDVRPGLEQELAGRGGWCGRVLVGGAVRHGDAVTVEPAGAAGEGRDATWLRHYLEAITAWEESPVAAGADGWTFRERLAHLIAWDERAATAIAASAEGAPDRHRAITDIDAFNAAAIARLTSGDPPPDLWVLHDTWSTAVVDAARLRPTEAEPWVRALTAHYREHT